MNSLHFSLTNIEHVYGSRTVLRIPELAIQKGEVLAIVGPSGAGKSTLLRLLALLEAPTHGAATFHTNQGPVTYHTASIEERRQLTMIFQRPVLLSRSVYANVRIGLRLRGERNGHKRIVAALQSVDLLKLAEAHARTLSGGEVQRVAIARALVIEPQVLLLDEPTANLDPANVRIIEQLIREQRADSNTTVVMVTHNIFQARRLANRVALLFDGDLVEVAATRKFFDAPDDPRTVAFLSGEMVY